MSRTLIILKDIFKYLLLILIIALICRLVFTQIEHYKQDDPILNNLKDIFTTFFSQDKYWSGNLLELNNRNIMEEINLYKGTKSYTINKQEVYLCLKDENGEYYNLNMLIYVLAHELAHVICNNIGHTPEFHAIFEDLLVELTDSNIYDPSQNIDPEYCKYGDNN